MDINKLKLKDRIKAPTPKFFKKIMAYGMGAIALGTGLIAMPATLGLSIPIMVKIGTIIITAGTALTAVSKTAVDVEKAIEKANE